ncbi:MAG TPA: addiction module protein [Acidobacteriota bacterium]|jgi:putative addiction module component (TIGR02574 family)
MARKLKEIFREAAELSENDRATPAAMLLESLESAPEPDAERAWAEEIERRLRQLAAGEVETVSWPQVREELFGRGNEER